LELARHACGQSSIDPSWPGLVLQAPSWDYRPDLPGSLEAEGDTTTWWACFSAAKSRVRLSLGLERILVVMHERDVSARGCLR
jgi:hypothetical protein